ncbi:hypothetical protein HA147_00260 [Prochlorococcus marinus XMU1410]|uniref:YadA-like family protein n=1 Tax=Prochlorococcus marinus TaxID=1219 RepID=UPI001AD9A07E|nr:YadA-like family protein [Prochlorococcus marinus]MBO8241082.1 hypothetical protein [Prochlorococcus marinus XMU1410]MBW3052265.1 hypothetical protein [Prochlorococcus marinus str. MU1410]
MKNTIGLLFLSSTIFGMPVLSEYDKWGINANNFISRDGINNTYTIDIQKWNSITGNYEGVGSLIQAEQSDFNTENDWKKDKIDINKSFYDSINGKMHFKSSTSNNKFIYDIKNNSFTTSTYERDKSESSYDINFDIPSVNGNSDGSFDIEIGGNTILKKNLDGSVQIGDDVNDIDITAEGVSIDGEPLISKKANGELHIGKNSWITKEENGKQKVWAKDAAGNSIPIDYTNGTKLLINGRDVEQSINNVGALSAALTGLPKVPNDTTLACGLGTGTHGGDFAFSGGCASKVNEKLSINYAASMTMPGQDYAGDFEDKFSARAGFIWKLGKSSKPSMISVKEKEELKEEISDLKANNKNIIAQNKALLERLERLEKIALDTSKSTDLATIKLP